MAVQARDIEAGVPQSERNQTGTTGGAEDGRHPPIVLSDRLLAAKSGLWNALLTSNALFAAAVFASYFAGQRPSDFWIPLTGIVSLVGVLAPIYCLSSAASLAAEDDGLSERSYLPALGWVRPHIWQALELVSVICLIGNGTVFMANL